MKNLTLIFAFLFIGWSVSASVNSIPASTNSNYYNDSFIFVEGGVEFAVYPNGEFDFYYNPDFRRGNSVNISSPNGNISYNSGYNYDPYIQYDDYGAVIQVENVPIYYDYYGRIIQAGNIYLNYNNFGRLSRVGNLYLHYDQYHHYTRYTGYINHYNRYYVYRPWHDYYRRPQVNVSVVFNRPYRAYYQPQRISYNKYVTVYNNYYATNKRKRNFYRPSERVRSYNYGTKTSSKRNIVYNRKGNSPNAAATRKSVARKRTYSDRANSRRSTKVNQARVYSDKNNRGSNTGISKSRESVYSGRTERSTNSRGSSSRINNAQKRQISGTESVKTPQRSSPNKVQNRTSERAQRSVPRRNTRTIQKSSGSSERKSTNARPTRQRSSSVKDRSTSGGSRSQAVRSKNSSRTRSSARNVNNRI